MTGCESAGGCAGCLDAFQEASLGLSGYSYLRHHLDAVNCPGVVYPEFRGSMPKFGVATKHANYRPYQARLAE